MKTVIEHLRKELEYTTRFLADSRWYLEHISQRDPVSTSAVARTEAMQKEQADYIDELEDAIELLENRNV